MRRLEVERRQIDGDAVEAGVHVLPVVSQAATGSRRQRAISRRG